MSTFSVSLGAAVDNINSNTTVPTQPSSGGGESETQRCKYYIEKRKRNCQVQVARGFQFCGEHAFRTNQPVSKPRIPCPLDPKHTVFVHQLKKHLKKCNSRVTEKPVYYSQGINNGTDENEYNGKRQLASFTPTEVTRLIEKLRKVKQAHILDYEESIHHHDLLRDKLSSETNGPSARKHLEQLSSILGNMEHLGFFASDSCYIEYGAGKGRLSQWIFDAVTEYSGNHFILVDRKNVRHKRDLHFKEVCQHLSMERLIIDIRDLDLTKVPVIRDNPGRPIVAYCKHLCGSATDLALRSLFPSHPTSRGSKPPAMRGVAMATCCHHRCTWGSYVGRDFLALHGFDRSDFEALIRLSSWSVCGSRGDGGQTNEEDASQSGNATVEHGGNGESARENGRAKRAKHDPDSHSAVVMGEDRETLTSALGLTISGREEIGRLAKSLLDAGRVDFLRGNGMTGRAVQYVKRETTLENTLLLAANAGDGSSVQAASRTLGE